MLYVVATPIGNLSDFSPRALETLKTVDLIAAEDTRVTMKLLSAFDVHTKLTSYHMHNEKEKAQFLVDKILNENMHIALVTDAGTPAISDPGTYLVKLCAENNIPCIPIPGPTAMASAVSVSGFDFTEFTFYGFLPREKKALREKLASMKGTSGAVIHESPYRIIDLMEEVQNVLPNALVSASCDLTKLHELTIRGTPQQVLDMLKANEKSNKGEYCVVLDVRNEKKPQEVKVNASLEARIFEKTLSGLSLKESVKALQEEGENKNALYRASLRVKQHLEGL